MKRVKSLKTLVIKEMSGRMFAVRQRMTNTEKKDEWTEISINVLDFDRNIPDYIFTLSNLRNPRK